MKKKFKIIFSILVLSILTIILNKVSAIGNVSHAWVETSYGKRELIFRTFTSPFDSTLAQYHNDVKSHSRYATAEGYEYVLENGNRYKSRWVPTETVKGVSLPSEWEGYYYRTLGLMFHKNQIGVYNDQSKLRGTNAGYITSTSPSTDKLDSIKVIYQNSSQHYTLPDNTSGSPLFENNIFYKIWNSTATIQKVNWGTGLKASGFNANANIEYRHCIINIDGKSESNVYVGDNIVHSKDLVELVKKVNEINQKENNKLFCYVSEAIVSKSFYTDYEVALSAANFFKQYGKHGYSTNFWGDGTRGFSSKGFGSVLNLFDNKIYFPQMSERKVYVRHINIGNNTVISKNIVNNGTRINPTTPYYLMLTDGTKLESSDTSQRDAYQEYFKGIHMDQGFTKNALPDPNPKTYTCIGYNVSTGKTLDEAKGMIDQRVNAGIFNKKDNSVTVNAKTLEREDDVTVIDFYYTEYEKNVYVNHIYVDKNGNVLEKSMQTIVPNDDAKEDGKTTINRINTDNVEEVYKKRLNHYITVRTADSLKDEIESGKVKYYGYETFDQHVDVSELIGQGVRVNLKEDQKTNLTSENVQVNFYYYYDNTKEEKEPQRDIEGKVFVRKSSNEDISTSCSDSEEGIIVTSIPSGTYATVGIKGIPRNMVAAIETDYQSPNQDRSMNITLNFKLGNETKTVTYNNFKYRVGFYKISNMALYQLMKISIYDAENNEGYDTIGTSIFNWASSTLNTMPKDKALNIKMTGINNKVIYNTSSSINDINNYVGISVKDKDGNTTNISATNSSLTRTYLTNEQIKEVDANGDKEINDKDKEYAIAKLGEFNQSLNNRRAMIENQEKNYNDQVKKRENLKKIYDNATEVLNQKQKTYNDAKNTLLSKKESYKSYKEYVESIEQKLQYLNDELIELNGEKNTLTQGKQQADSALAEAENKKAELESIIQTLSGESLEDAIVEYQSFLDNEYANAVMNVSDLEDKIKTKEDEIKNKQSEINAMNLNAIAARSWCATLLNDATTYEKNTYKKAKDDYESYRDNEYKTAKDNYESNLNGKELEDAFDKYEKAKALFEEVEKQYNEYNSYKNNLEAKYNDYKAKYDEYISINPNYPKLGLKLNISVQNMIVNVNGQNLASSSSNTATKEYDLDTYLDMSEVPSIMTERPVISKDVYSNIGSTLVREAEYNNKNYINKEVLNGERTLAGKAEYKLQMVIGDKDLKEIEDNVYYSEKNTDSKTHIFKFKKEDKAIIKTYKVDTTVNVKDDVTRDKKHKEVEPINIYTPISVSVKLTSNLNQVVDQSLNKNGEVQVIQVNAPFRIDFSNENKPVGYNVNNTNKFSDGYYIKFDFDIHNVKINGKIFKDGSRISAGKWIRVIRNSKGKAYIEAQPYGNTDEDKVDIVTEQIGNYVVRSYAYNTTQGMISRSLIYNTLQEMKNETGEWIDNICNPISYFAEEDYSVVIINRAYDFRVTDVKDVNWKNVFRTSNSQNTNAHKRVLYYAGTTKWNTKSERANDIVTRTASEIGRNPLRILPIGPYKSSDVTYVKSPKMGYRFSFDMKVTGSYFNFDGSVNKDKKVEINTKFYYISKDGKKFLEEFNGNDKGIYLFYKTANGKYVKIDENGGDYELNFIPNDGYRYIENSDTSTLSKKSVKLGSLRKIYLTYNMATVSNNSSYITYYGEYKLPNSTIAVEVDKNGNYDINKPLNKGYIGVIFDITAYAGKIKNSNMMLSYSKNTKTDVPNTSQWDYEGYLGYTKYGKKLTSESAVTIPLESGTWKIDTDELYNKIKGTVMLYEIDYRAATDFD